MNKLLYILKVKILSNKSFKHLKTFIFLFGFLIDWATLPKITNPVYIWIGAIYILVLLVLFKLRSIFVYTHKEQSYSFVDYLSKYFSLGISFFLGSLLSYILVYYFKSTEIVFSWPLLIFIVFSILANEFLHNRVSDYILFFIGSTFYFIFNIPVFYKDVNNISFVLSIGISILFSAIFLRFIKIKDKWEKLLVFSFAIIWPTLLLSLYSLHLMPAVPLYLKDKGFYSNIKKSDNDYIKQEFYQSSESIFFYSSIISPTEVRAKITHNWYKYEIDNWSLISVIEFPIYGGREEGYRGYSYIKNRGIGEYKVIVKSGDMLVGQKILNVYSDN